MSPRRAVTRELVEHVCPGCHAPFRSHNRNLKYCVPYCGVLYNGAVYGHCYLCGIANEDRFVTWFTPEMRAEADQIGRLFADAHTHRRQLRLDQFEGLGRLERRCATCLADPSRVDMKELYRPFGGRGRTRSSSYRKHRDAVLARDGWTCQICFEPIDADAPSHDDWSLTLDHEIQVANGGSDELDNLRAAHRWCNISREGPLYWGEDEFVRQVATTRYQESHRS